VALEESIRGRRQQAILSSSGSIEDERNYGCIRRRSRFREAGARTKTKAGFRAWRRASDANSRAGKRERAGLRL